MHRDGKQHDGRKWDSAGMNRGTLHVQGNSFGVFDRRAAAYLQEMFDSETSERVCPGTRN
jgi:hypothetical protein